MITNLANPECLGISMIFPVTWEENIAANMSKIPLTELFPGLMVSDLYKAYRAGLQSEKYSPYDGSDPLDFTVGYIADTTGTMADVVRDFLDAMIKTVAQGKAPADILTGKAPTGTGEKTGEVFKTVTTKAGEAIKSVSASFIPFAVIGISAFALYALYAVMPRRR